MLQIVMSNLSKGVDWLTMSQASDTVNIILHHESRKDDSKHPVIGQNLVGGLCIDYSIIRTNSKASGSAIFMCWEIVTAP